jgi:hypothetical protein
MTYTVGHIVLAHTDLNRTFELVDYLTNNNSPVVIHIDQKTPVDEFNELHSKLKSNDLVHFIPRTNTEWGSMSLVTATINCAREMIERFPQAGHIFLTSGSCLPTRPVSDLQEFLARHQGTDFVESVSIESEDWVQDGLSSERFKYYFPFSWKKQRWLFDTSTWLQRKLHINRKRPDDFIPHLGSQWWCITKRTLTEIMDDPRRRAFDRYFQKSWIPDEAYFQTLVRKHSEKLESRSLTWSKFDSRGKPFLLYDDHIDLLPQADFFMARKAWAKADLLYSSSLSDEGTQRTISTLEKNELTRFFDNVKEAQRPAPVGKINPGRFPTGAYAKRNKTARAYTVLMGALHVYPDLQGWLNLKNNVICHGNLFDQEGVAFSEKETHFRGNVSANRLIRNYRASAFLENIIWNKREVAQAFFFDLGDNQKAHNAIFKDPNAHVIMIDEAWILHYLSLQKTGADTRSKAKLLFASEQRLNRVIARGSTEAQIIRFSISDVIANPQNYLRAVLETASQMSAPLVSTPMQDVNLNELNRVIHQLRNDGFKLETEMIANPICAPSSHENPRVIKK